MKTTIEELNFLHQKHQKIMEEKERVRCNAGEQVQYLNGYLLVLHLFDDGRDYLFSACRVSALRKIDNNDWVESDARGNVSALAGNATKVDAYIVSNYIATATLDPDAIKALDQAKIKYAQLSEQLAAIKEKIRTDTIVGHIVTTHFHYPDSVHFSIFRNEIGPESGVRAHLDEKNNLVIDELINYSLLDARIVKRAFSQRQ